MELASIFLLALGFFAVAIFYSSIGHGGASGYLMLLAFLPFSHLQISSTALLLNILVSAVAFYAFYKKGFFSLKLVLPFVLASIPAAFLGGLISITPELYSILLGLALLFLAFRLLFELRPPVSADSQSDKQSRPSPLVALSIGGVIGLLSGIIGIGGGIILSPIILIMKWADTKQTAALSAFFILLNSVAGLSARLVHGSFGLILSQELAIYVVFAFLGALVGSHLGVNIFSKTVFKRVLVIVVVFAAVKLIMAAL